MKCTAAPSHGAGHGPGPGPMAWARPGDKVGPGNRVGPGNKVGPGNEVGPGNKAGPADASVCFRMHSYVFVTHPRMPCIQLNYLSDHKYTTRIPAEKKESQLKVEITNKNRCLLHRKTIPNPTQYTRSAQNRSTHFFRKYKFHMISSDRKAGKKEVATAHTRPTSSISPKTAPCLRRSLPRLP